MMLRNSSIKYADAMALAIRFRLHGPAKLFPFNRGLFYGPISDVCGEQFSDLNLFTLKCSGGEQSFIHVL